jgi:hypothetical protein
LPSCSELFCAKAGCGFSVAAAMKKPPARLPPAARSAAAVPRRPVRSKGRAPRCQAPARASIRPDPVTFHDSFLFCYLGDARPRLDHLRRRRARIQAPARRPVRCKVPEASSGSAQFLGNPRPRSASRWLAAVAARHIHPARARAPACLRSPARSRQNARRQTRPTGAASQRTRQYRAGQTSPGRPSHGTGPSSPRPMRRAVTSGVPSSSRAHVRLSSSAEGWARTCWRTAVSEGRGMPMNGEAVVERRNPLRRLPRQRRSQRA